MVPVPSIYRRFLGYQISDAAGSRGIVISASSNLDSHNNIIYPGLDVIDKENYLPQKRTRPIYFNDVEHSINSRTDSPDFRIVK